MSCWSAAGGGAASAAMVFWLFCIWGLCCAYAREGASVKTQRHVWRNAVSRSSTDASLAKTRELAARAAPSASGGKTLAKRRRRGLIVYRLLHTRWPALHAFINTRSMRASFHPRECS